VLLTMVVAASLTMPVWTCEAEDARIVKHLQDALVQLRTSPPEGLSASQRARRAIVLDHLEQYLAARQFPRRHGPASPVFVDEDGAACAMGALIAATGGASITDHIRRTRNFATVPQLVDEPGLVPWLVENGIAPEEAALVQPTYFACRTSSMCWNARAQGLVMVVTAHDGGASPPPYVTAISRPEDGLCAGEPALRRFQGLSYADDFGWLREWTEHLPVGAMVEPDAFLVWTTRGPMTLDWSRCSEAPAISQAMRQAPTREACIRASVKADPLLLLPVCYHSGTPLSAMRCGASGRIISDRLPAAGTLADFIFNAYWLEPARDAGFDWAASEALEAWAWANSDDGGGPPVPVNPNRYLRWDGGVDLACIAARDAGLWPDAGVRPDGGSSTADAGVAAPDAGASLDAGPARDAGPSVDAGRPLDGGAPTDAGAWSLPPPRKDTFVPPATYAPNGADAGCSSTGGSLAVLTGLLALRVRRRYRR
jgi:hypothetical protein